MPSKPSHALALIEVLLVSLIWGSSFIFVKMALADLGPLTLGGLRYFLGFAALAPFMLRNRRAVTLTRSHWLRLLLLGLSAYTIGNGAMFWALKYLSATTVSFLMSLVTLLILFGGILWLREIPNRMQTAGIIATMVGIAMFFSPGLRPGEPLGLAILTIGLLSFTLFGLLGRDVARERQVDTLTLTAIPLALGGGILLLIAIPLEGLPHASPGTWGLVLWLAAVNTALGYILYNHALQVLTAFQVNVLLNLSPLWTALMGWLLLDEQMAILQWLGIAVVIAGASLVQRPRQAGEKQAN